MSGPAAEPAGAGRVRDERPPGKEYRSDLLDHFDRCVGDVARESGRIEPVLVGPRAHPARAEERKDVWRIVIPLAGERDRAEDRALGDDPVRNRRRKGIEDREGNEQSDQMAPADRSRMPRVEYGTLRRAHADRPQRAVVIRDVGAQRAFERVEHEGLGVVQNAIDALCDLRRGSLEIDLERIARNRDGDRDRQGFAEPVEHDAAAIASVGKRRDRLPHLPFRPGRDLVGDPAEIGKPLRIHEVAQPVAGDVVRRNLRGEIAKHQFGRPHVVLDDAKQSVVRYAGVEQLHDRDLQPLLVDRFRRRREDPSADIHGVAIACGKPDEFAAAVDRGDDGDVVLVSRDQPRVVGDEDVASPETRRSDRIDDVVHADAERPEMPRRALHGLGQHDAPGIEYRRRQVFHLAQNGGESAVDHGRGLFVRDRDQAVPAQFDRYRVELCVMPRHRRLP